MCIEDIPDNEFYAEYRRREEIRVKNKKALKKDMEDHRTFWLESHGGTNGNDLCNNGYCRIYCENCDDDLYEYDPNWKNRKSTNSSSNQIDPEEYIDL